MELELTRIDISNHEPDGSELYKACRTVGFARLVGFEKLANGKQILDGIAEAADTFYFRLSAEERDYLARRTRNYYRGYTPAALHANHHKNTIDFGWGDPDEPHTEPDGTVRIPGPNVWPGVEPCGGDWQEKVKKYINLQFEVSKRVLKSLLKEIDSPFSDFEAVFNRSSSTLRLMHYPPIQWETTKDLKSHGFEKLECIEESGKKVTPCSSPDHVDSGFLTTLLLDETGGLEVKHPRTGTWQAVEPEEYTVILNVGRPLSVLSKGQLEATRHRVRAQKTHRMAIPFFLEPNADYAMPMIYADYLRNAVAGFDEYKHLERKRHF